MLLLNVLLKVVPLPVPRDFNTSYVVIKLHRSFEEVLDYEISIHLMLLLNDMSHTIKTTLNTISIHLMLLLNPKLARPYFSSYGISIHLMLLLNPSK